MIEYYKLVKEMVSEFFEKLFADPNPASTPTHWCGKTLFEAQSQPLTNPIFKVEIKEALFSLTSDIAPCPDRYIIEFCKGIWDLPRDEFMNAIELFFKENYFLVFCKCHIKSLIGKVDNPVKMKECRPISFCNVICKVISKVLINILKTLLTSLGL